MDEKRNWFSERKVENARMRIRGCIRMQDIIWNEINLYLKSLPKTETERDYIRIYNELNEIIKKESELLC